MTPADFTLRDALPASAGRDEPPCDFVFRAGRLAAKRPGSPGARPRLYLSPGFRDAHVHLLHVGLRDQRCDLGGAGSLAEALEAVAAFAREREGGGILWAENWDESGWPEGRGPLGEDLDRVVPDRPAVMRRVCGHKAVLNGRARAEAALRWPDLDRSGVVTEERAMRLASVWPPTPEERERALRSAQGCALSMGIVRVGEMGSDGALDAFLELRKRDALRIDVDYFVRPSQIELALRLRDEGWLAGGGLRLGGVKLFADGSIGARTAALREPYADGEGRGELLYGDDELAALLRRCLEAELPVAVHAIGDAAIDQVAGRLEAIAGASGPLPVGWASIEHAELLTGDLLERCAALGVRLSMQPNFVARWGGAGGLYERALGPDRWRAMNPWRSALAAGLPVVFGSDGMPMGPALGLVGATTHPQPEQRLSPAEALEVYEGRRACPWNPAGSGESWPLGSHSFVLYEVDPLKLAEGESARAPARAVFSRGAWIEPPPESLLRWGLVHVD